MADILKNITLIGASGHLGVETLKALTRSDKHNITVITRPSSTAEYPSQVKVTKGNYDDPEFLVSTLKGQDAVIIMLGFAGLPYQDGIFEASAQAGVKYVLPMEYGVDSSNEKMVMACPVATGKADIHRRVKSLGMKWIAVVTGLWIDYGLQYGPFDINVVEKSASIYADSAPFNMCTLPQIGKGIAAMLALPAATIEEKFANGYLYLSSFRMTQPELFSAVLRVTGTHHAGWKVEDKAVQDLIDEGHRMIDAGQSMGHFKIIFGVTYKDGFGGDYSQKLHNKMLGLEEEDLDEAVKSGIDAAKPGPWEAGATMPK